MKAKFYFISVILGLAFMTNLYAEDDYIIFITASQADSGYVELLEDEGYNVLVRGPGEFGHENAQDKLDSINNSILVIKSRSLSSWDYVDLPDVDKLWNEDITVPVISMSPWILRNDRLKWFDTGDVACCMTSMKINEDITDIFHEVTSEDGIITPFLEDEEVTYGADFINVEAEGTGNAEVLATHDEEEHLIAIAHWWPDDESYQGSGQFFGARRMFLALSDSDCGACDDPNSVLNVNENGKTLFLNAVCDMIEGCDVIPDETSVEEVSASKVNFNLYPNPANESITVSFKASYANNADISIVNLAGQTVYSNIIPVNVGNNSLNINIKDLNSGVYILRINVDKYQVYEKLLIE